MKFKSDIEVQAGIKDSAGSSGNAGSILSSTSTGVTWIDNYSDWTSVVKHVVKNNGVAVIPKGAPVYVTGSDGTNMLVGLAGNGSEATSSKTMGLVQTQLGTTGSTQTGYVVTEGLLQGLDTSGRIAGEPIWLGPNGTLIYGLTNKPYAPAHLVFIGIVTKVSAGNGEVFVNVQNGFELNEIHDVDIKTTVPINGDVLGFDGTLWVNKTIAGWLGYVPANASGTQNYVSKFTGTTVLADSQLYDDGVNIGINSSSFPNSFEKVFKINGKDSFETINNGSYVDFFIDAQNLTGNDSNIYDTKNVYSNNIKYQWYSEYSSSGLYNIFYHPAGYLNQNGSNTYFMYTDTGYDNALKQKTAFQLNGNDKLVLLENGEVVIGDDSWYSVSNTYKSTIRSTDANQFTTNLAGKDLYIQGGRGRGAGAGGRVIISTAPSGTSGSQLNNVIDSVIVDSSGNVDVYGNTTSNSFIKVGGNSTQYLMADGSVSTSVTARAETLFTATSGQTTFTINYTVGQLDVYYNGSKLSPSEFTATNGTSVTLGFSCDAGEIISVITYSTQVNGALGTTNYIPKFTGTNTFSNSLIYDNGTNVGVGTTNPLAILTTANTGNLTLNSNDGDHTGFGLYIQAPSTTNSISSAIGFGVAQRKLAAIAMQSYADADQAGLNFYVQPTSSGSAGILTEAMRINSNGRVGIGSAGGSSLLQLTNDGTFPQLILQSTTGVGWRFSESLGTLTVDPVSGATRIIKLTNSGSGSLTTIVEEGNVLIGTTTDSGYKLDVNGTGRFSDTINTTNGTVNMVMSYNTSGIIGTTSNHDLQIRTNNTERIKIAADGKVGIGNVTPQTLTHLYTSTGQNIPDLGSAGGHLTIQTGGVIATVMGVNVNGNFYIQPQRINNGGTNVYNTLLNPSGGNVGIGTTNPSYKLDVSTSSGENYIRVDSALNQDCGYRFSENGVNKWLIYNVAASDALAIYDNTASAERMRITSGGDVLVGCQSVPGAGGSVQGISLISSGAITALRAAATVGYFGRTNSGELFAFFNNTAKVGSISIGASSTSYNTSSDYRLKEDLQPMVGALERLQQLKPINFAWKSSGERVDGFIAHELAEVIPEAVTGKKDDTEEVEVTPAILDEEGNIIEEAVFETRDVYQGIDQSKIVPLLVAAMQEQQAQIQELKAEIEILKNK